MTDNKEVFDRIRKNIKRLLNSAEYKKTMREANRGDDFSRLRRQFNDLPNHNDLIDPTPKN